LKIRLPPTTLRAIIALLSCALCATSSAAPAVTPPPKAADIEQALRQRFAPPPGAKPYSADAPTYVTTYSEAEQAEQRQRGSAFREELFAAIAAKKTTFTVPPGVYRLPGGELGLRGVQGRHLYHRRHRQRH
jgi:hypothetical protein